MTRLKLDQDDLALSSVIERVTGAQVKDCFKDEETLFVIVAPGEVGRAVGRNGENIHRLQAELGKRIKVIEYQDQAAAFVRKVIYPLNVQEIREEELTLIIRDSNKKTKSLLIGRDGRNLRNINRAVQRFFNKEVKVI